MFGILNHGWAVEPQQFAVAMEVRRRDEEVERVARRKERCLVRRGRHGCERALQQLGETETRKGRLEPTPADEVRYLAPNLGARGPCWASA